MDRKTKVLVFRWIKPHHLIILMVLSMVLSIFVGYAISVGYNHVEALFPYISDTGTRPPGSCAFGLLLNIGGMFTFIIMYLRHSQYEKFHARDNRRHHVVNDVTMVLGFTSALGALIVANFQETSVISIHLLGALMTLVAGVIYCWLQNYLSYNTAASRCILYTRFALTTISTVTLVTTMIGTSIWSKMLSDKNLNSWNYKLNYTKDLPGYDYHLMATFSEWIMVFGFIGYFVTFYGEFKQFGTSLAIIRNNHIFNDDISNDEEPMA